MMNKLPATNSLVSKKTLLNASEKALKMLEYRSKYYLKDILLDSCIKDAQSCYNLSGDPYWKNVEMYLKDHFNILHK